MWVHERNCFIRKLEKASTSGLVDDEKESPSNAVRLSGELKNKEAAHGNARHPGNYMRTNPKTVDKIKDALKSKKQPKEIFADLKRDDSMNCARDFRVIRNLKQQEEKKMHKLSNRANVADVADEILEVLSMLNDHPFVQTIIHNKGQVPNIICYKDQQILDLKHFVENNKNQPKGIDRTFNLGTFYVTLMV